MYNQKEWVFKGPRNHDMMSQSASQPSRLETAELIGQVAPIFTSFVKYLHLQIASKWWVRQCGRKNSGSFVPKSQDATLATWRNVHQILLSLRS